jgi:hypothetical protein
VSPTGANGSAKCEPMASGLLPRIQRPLLEVIVKTRLALLSFTAATFIAAASWSGVALAQQNSTGGQQAPAQTQQPPDSQVPPSATQDPAQTGQQNQGQTQPDQTQSDTGTKQFVGTVIKQGDKYVFQDSATGNIYDIDHQDEVSKFEGKKVRVHGALDPSGKMIHLQ